ncbi:MAG: ribonuclease P protein component [Bryobacteraceae bacterium]
MSAQSVTPSSDDAARPSAFPKAKRLLKRSDYQRVYEHGSRFTGPYFSMFFLRRDDTPANAAISSSVIPSSVIQGPRTGFTTPRALGKAVVRNRIRRRVREALRLEIPSVTAPVDIVFNPKRTALEAGFEDLRREVRRVLAKCGH